MKAWCLLAAFAATLGAALLSGCASFKQEVVMVPLRMDSPVSASSSLYVNGLLIPESQLKQVKEFEFDKFFSPHITAREARLDLADDLSRVVKESARIGLPPQNVVAFTPDSWLRHRGRPRSSRR